MAKSWPKGGRTPELWRKRLERIAGWVPVDFLLAWMDTESGGRLSVVSTLNERGLFQVHPDEVTFLGMTQDEFERLPRDATLALRYGVKAARLFAFQAKKALNAVGVDWHGRDFWKLVKLYHGAFALPSSALNAFARANGHGPQDWSELYAFVISEANAGHDLVPGNVRLSQVLRRLSQSVMDNAEKTGEASELPIYHPTQVAFVRDLLRSVALL